MSAPAATAAPATAATATTVFVRNIPYSWRDSDLERAFEQIGPIKRAFVVTARGAKRAHALGDDGAVTTPTAAKAENRGFAFVEFATNSDARRAVEEMGGKEVEDPSAAAAAVAPGGKKKGPQKLAVELSVPKGEKPTIAPKKDATTAASASASVGAAATATPAATAAASAKKGEKVKDLKLDAALVEEKKNKKATAVVKAASDSETSESEDEETEAEKKDRKAAAKAKLEATTASTAKPAASSAHAPTRTFTTTAATAAPSKATSTPLPASASRTVLLSGINTSVKNLSEHLKGLISNIQDLLFPSPESTLKYKAARLTFTTEALAEAAVKLLDKKLIKGDPVRAIRLHNEQKANRLILRNIPWNVSEKRLHLIFKECCKPLEAGGGDGKIVGIDLPKEADGKSKGFGFISFTTLKAAELALKKTGTVVGGRPIAVDWALAKDDYVNRVKLNEVEEKKAADKATQKAAKVAEKQKADAKASKKESAKVKAEQVDGDEVAVKKEESGDGDGDADMLDLQADRRKNKSILSSILGDEDNAANEAEELEERKEKIKKEAHAAGIKTATKVKEEDDMSDVDQDDDDDDESMASGDEDDENDEDESDEGSDHDDDDINMSDDSLESDDSAAEDDDDDEAAPELDQTTTPKFTHPRVSDTLKGCTVFLRNLSYDTTEEKLVDKFSQFGEVKYGKVVWDKELDRSRGTAFVQFADPVVAKKVVGMSVDTSTNPAQLYKKNRITAAVASGQGITLDGRVLNIALAVDREQATTLAEKNKEKQKEDKRNLYLANEGNIRADSEAAKTMPPAELEKREKAFREKKKKLKNPNYCVSRTRLSVRNLPLEADEKLLKRVFLKAARDAVKAQPKDSPLRDGTIGQPTLQQVKLLRSTDRLDSKGEGRSKRYGFVEFDRHEHSLLALRALNNNPDAFAGADLKTGKHSRPFVEFALEDARKLLIRTQKLAAANRRKEIKAKQQAELDAAEGKPVKEKKPQVKSSEQVRKKPLKQVVDPSAGGGRGACFNCGLGGHISRNCPTAGAEDGETKAPPASGEKRKATSPAEASEPASKKAKSDAAAAPAPAVAAASTKKNKNNKHKDVAIPKHLGRGDDKEEAHFDKLVQAHKQKFFGADAANITAAASRWFD